MKKEKSINHSNHNSDGNEDSAARRTSRRSTINRSPNQTSKQSNTSGLLSNELNKKDRKWLFVGVAGIIVSVLGFLIVILWHPLFDRVFKRYEKEVEDLSKRVTTSSWYNASSYKPSSDTFYSIPGKRQIDVTQANYFYNVTNANKVVFRGEWPRFVETGPILFTERQAFAGTSDSWMDING